MAYLHRDSWKKWLVALGASDKDDLFLIIEDRFRWNDCRQSMRLRHSINAVFTLVHSKQFGGEPFVGGHRWWANDFIRKEMIKVIEKMKATDGERVHSFQLARLLSMVLLTVMMHNVYDRLVRPFPRNELPIVPHSPQPPTLEQMLKLCFRSYYVENGVVFCGHNLNRTLPNYRDYLVRSATRFIKSKFVEYYNLNFKARVKSGKRKREEKEKKEQKEKKEKHEGKKQEADGSVEIMKEKKPTKIRKLVEKPVQPKISKVGVAVNAEDGMGNDSIEDFDDDYDYDDDDDNDKECICGETNDCSLCPFCKDYPPTGKEAQDDDEDYVSESASEIEDYDTEENEKQEEPEENDSDMVIHASGAEAKSHEDKDDDDECVVSDRDL